MPAVDEGHLRRRKEQHPVIGRTILEFLQFAILEDHRAATEPRTIGRARAPLPLAAEQIMIALVFGLAHRRKNAAGDNITRTKDFLRNRFRHIGRAQRRSDCDHHAPAGAGIRFRNRGDDFHKVERFQFQSTERCWFGQIERARVGQLGR